MIDLSEYNIMWVMVSFDLPTETKKDVRAATQFRKRLLLDGFSMFQFSMYVRHCASMDNAEVHIKRISAIVPDAGTVAIMCLTDKQFGNIKVIRGAKKAQLKSQPIQLEMF